MECNACRLVKFDVVVPPKYQVQCSVSLDVSMKMRVEEQAGCKHTSSHSFTLPPFGGHSWHLAGQRFVPAFCRLPSNKARDVCVKPLPCSLQCCCICSTLPASYTCCACTHTRKHTHKHSHTCTHYGNVYCASAPQHWHTMSLSPHTVPPCPRHSLPTYIPTLTTSWSYLPSSVKELVYHVEVDHRMQ